MSHPHAAQRRLRISSGGKFLLLPFYKLLHSSWLSIRNHLVHNYWSMPLSPGRWKSNLQQCVILEKNMPTYNTQDIRSPARISFTCRHPAAPRAPPQHAARTERLKLSSLLVSSVLRDILEWLVCTHRNLLNYYLQLRYVCSAHFVGSVQPVIAPLTASVKMTSSGKHGTAQRPADTAAERSRITNP